MDEEHLEVKNKWNIRHLDPPPLTTFQVDRIIDISDIQKSFKVAIDFFENQTPLERDATLLSRTVFRMKDKFRTDKGFKFMQKLSKSLRKYFEINFLSVIQNFYELLPKTVRPGTYLPTSNMLDYVIVRLQGLTALTHYLAETAITGAHLMEERIAIGHYWKVAFFAYALLSRIWFLCNNIIDFCCKFYKEILPMRNMFGKGSNVWAGDSYEFPKSLESMFNIQQLQSNPSKDFLKELHNESDIEPIRESSNKLVSGEEEKQRNKEKQESVLPKQKSAFELLLEEEEMGEVVVENKQLKPKKTKKKGKLKQTDGKLSLELFKNINSFKALKIFLAKESLQRTKDRSKSIFKNVDGLQWNMLQNKIKKMSKKAAKNKDKSSLHLHNAIKMLKSFL